MQNKKIMETINTFELSHFKAFEDSIKLNFQGKNALIFGENGSGKTSFFDGLKFFFFRNKIEKGYNISASTTPEDAEQKRQEMKEKYRNARTNIDFSLLLNDKSIDDISRDDYNVFLVTHENFELSNNNILLNDILDNLYFDYGLNTINSILDLLCDDLQSAVNKSLRDDFSETITVKFDKVLVSDEECHYRCVLSDCNGSLVKSTELSNFFNEGKLHLILLIIYLNVVFLLMSKEKTNLLVLDDFVTSLDAANRAFVLKYLFENTEKQESLQIILLTHNVSFYNLTMHYVKTYLNQNKWVYFNLYCYGGKCKIYSYEDDSIEKIKEDLKQGLTLEDAGNRIRQIFEIQVHTLAKIIISGGVEDTKNILARFRNGEPLYYNNGKDVFDLVKTIESYAKISSIDKNTLTNKILTEINSYKNDTSLTSLRIILKDMTLFQKVSLHPTSHGTEGLTPVSQKELNESLALVEKIAGHIKSMDRPNIVNM